MHKTWLGPEIWRLSAQAISIVDWSSRLPNTLKTHQKGAASSSPSKSSLFSSHLLLAPPRPSHGGWGSVVQTTAPGRDAKLVFLSLSKFKWEAATAAPCIQTGSQTFHSVCSGCPGWWLKLKTIIRPFRFKASLFFQSRFQHSLQYRLIKTDLRPYAS